MKKALIIVIILVLIVTVACGGEPSGTVVGKRIAPRLVGKVVFPFCVIEVQTEDGKIVTLTVSREKYDKINIGDKYP